MRQRILTNRKFDNPYAWEALELDTDSGIVYWIGEDRFPSKVVSIKQFLKSLKEKFKLSSLEAKDNIRTLIKYPNESFVLHKNLLFFFEQSVIGFSFAVNADFIKEKFTEMGRTFDPLKIKNFNGNPYDIRN